MKEISPGIYWIRSPLDNDGTSLTHVNIYLVRGKDGYLLVDTGLNTDESYAILEKSLAEIRAGIKDISQVFVTHIHPDHYGMAGRIRDISGAPIYLHEIETESIDSRYVNMDKLMEQSGEWLRRNGVPEIETGDMGDAAAEMIGRVIPARPDILLQGGETVTTGEFTFSVMWTPGHSSGHVCLYEADKHTLLSGDHVLPVITPNIGMQPQSLPNPLGKYLDSLREIRQLDISLVLPGHDEPFTDLTARIDEMTDHHAQRNEEILAAVSSQPRTAFDIAGYVTWGTNASWHDLPHIHRRMAIFETLAHLELMTVNGRVEKINRDNVIYYQKR